MVRQAVGGAGAQSTRGSSDFVGRGHEEALSLKPKIDAQVIEDGGVEDGRLRYPDTSK